MCSWYKSFLGAEAQFRSEPSFKRLKFRTRLNLFSSPNRYLQFFNVAQSDEGLRPSSPTSSPTCLGQDVAGSAKSGWIDLQQLQDLPEQTKWRWDGHFFYWGQFFKLLLTCKKIFTRVSLRRRGFLKKRSFTNNCKTTSRACNLELCTFHWMCSSRFYNYASQLKVSLARIRLARSSHL